MDTEPLVAPPWFGGSANQEDAAEDPASILGVLKGPFVPTAAVSTVAPYIVVLGLLHDRRIACAQQNRSQVRVLNKLGEDRLVHDRVLDRFPVLAEWPLAAAAHPGGDPRRLRLPDLFLTGRSGELLGLEVVLALQPLAARQKAFMHLVF